VFSVFPVEEADRVFEQLSQSTINGRAVLRVSSSESDGDLQSGDDAMDNTPTGPQTTADTDTAEPSFFLPDTSA